MSASIPAYVRTDDRSRETPRHAPDTPRTCMHVYTRACFTLAKVTTAKRVFLPRKLYGDDVGPIVRRVCDNFSRRPPGHNTCAAGTFHPVAVYPYRPRNFLPTRESAIPALEKGTRRIRVAISLAGCGGQGAAGADGYPGVGFLETRKGWEGVRYVKYVCRIFRRFAAC